jgi:hypothetical protein
MSKFNAGQSFADGDTVTGAKLNNIAGLLDIYTGLISEQTAMVATVSTADQLLIADVDNGDSGAANRVTVQKLLNDGLTNGTFSNLSLTGNLNVTQLSTLGTINNTRGTVGILNSTTGTIQSLNSTTGTIGTLNNTTGTIGTLVATGTITGSTNIVNIGSGQIYKDAIGNVGIGVASPEAKLDVNGTLQLRGSGSEGGEINFLNTGNASVGMTIDVSSGSNVGRILTAATNSELKLGQLVGTGGIITAHTAAAERMRIDASGNVGIGTTSPAYQLNVQSAGSAATVNRGIVLRTGDQTNFFRLSSVYNTTTTSGAFPIQSGGLYWEHGGGFGASGGLVIATNSANAGPVILATADTERLRIDSSGNVGIGTTSPASPLHVRGTSIFGTVNVQSLSTNAEASISFYDSADTNADKWVIGKNITVSSDQFCFYKNGIQAVFDTNGNFGIGVAAPVNKLEVVGSFGRGAPVTKTTDFTLAATENWIIVNKATTCIATLPAASSWTGREFTIKTLQAVTVVSPTSNISPLNSATPGTAILPATAGAWATLVSNGTNWVTMAASA